MPIKEFLKLVTLFFFLLLETSIFYLTFVFFCNLIFSILAVSLIKMYFTQQLGLRRIFHGSYHQFRVIPKPSIWPKRERLKRFTAVYFFI